MSWSIKYLSVMRRLVFILLVSCFFTEVVAGGGWPIGKGKGYFKLGQNLITSSLFYNPAGELVDIRTTSLFTTSIYAEYGFSERLTGIVYFPFFVRGTLNEERFIPSGNRNAGEAVNALGDTDVALKYTFIKDKPIVVSAMLTLGIPLGVTRAGESNILQTGDGEFNQMLQIDASTSFYPVPLYASALVAFNNRTNNFSDEIRWGVEVGYTFFKKLTTIGKVYSVHSLFNGADEVAENGIFSNNTEYLSPSVEVGYQLTESWGVSVSAAYAFSGRNILASPNYGAGIYFKL